MFDSTRLDISSPQIVQFHFPIWHKLVFGYLGCVRCRLVELNNFIQRIWKFASTAKVTLFLFVGLRYPPIYKIGI